MGLLRKGFDLLSRRGLLLFALAPAGFVGDQWRPHPIRVRHPVFQHSSWLPPVVTNLAAVIAPTLLASSDEGSDSWSEESSEEDEPLLDVNDDDDSSSPKRDKRKRSRMVSNDQSSSTRGSARTKGPSTKTKSQWELQRVEHNESVKARIEDKRAFRTNFLTQNLKVMEPFMDEATLQKWSGKENQSISTADSEDPKSGTEETPAPAPLPASFSSVQFKLREIHIQPELVEGGEMRDYQMLGLQFLVNMYRQNLGMILGDEMGLVSRQEWLQGNHGSDHKQVIFLPALHFL